MSSVGSKFCTKHLYYPLFLDISGKLCIVLGGGKIAERKVSMLLKFNARVRVISPKITKNLSRLSKSGNIEVVQREYRDRDLDGALLVFAATNNKDINISIRQEAEKRNVLVNVVDDPAQCNFIVPSIIKKDPVIVAISTSGTLPLLSKKLRKEISNHISGDYIKYAQIVGRFRNLLIETVKDKKKRGRIMKEIDKADLRELTSMNINDIKNKFLKH